MPNTQGGTAGSVTYEPPGGEAADYEPCPPSGTPCAIMPLGDSITYGVMTDAGSDGGYRPPLFHLALAAGKSITFVGQAINGPDTVDGMPFPKQNEGFPGYSIDGGNDAHPGISAFTGAHLERDKPQIVTLMIGTNDIAFDINASTAPARLGALLDIITTARPKTLLLVAQLTPGKTDTYNAAADAYNAAIPALVKARTDQGKHIVLVDMNKAFTANPNYKTEYLGDDVHPLTVGYAKMAETWYAALAPYLR